MVSPIATPPDLRKRLALYFSGHQCQRRPVIRFLLVLSLFTWTPLLARIRPSRVQGPHHLSGWKLESTVEGAENQGPLPIELVLARDGRVIRRIHGEPFLWTWMFRPNGTQVAYETGPLHFAMTCILADIASGRQLATYDCFSEPSHDAPNWVKELEEKSLTSPTP